MARGRLGLALALLVLALGPALLPSGSARAAGGALWAWGRDDYGQVGDGTIGNPAGAATPAQVSGLSGVVAVAAGAQHNLAITASGATWAWGDDSEGELGDGIQGPDRAAPQPVTIVPAASAVAAGAYHSLLLARDGSVWSWGRDAEGQLGDGTVGAPNAIATPIQLYGLQGITAIAAGAFHSLALRDDGTVLAWGNDYAGQLGDGAPGNPVFVPTPQPVRGLTDVVAIAGGYAHSLALRSDGTVWAWGRDDHGQLGDGLVGTPGDSGTPRQVLGLTGARAIAAGESHSMALRGDGTVWVWGNGNAGQLGDGSLDVIDDRPLPIPVLGLGNVTGIAAGRFHSLALTSLGVVWAWGADTFGELGDGVVGAPTLVATPGLVRDLSGVTQIVSGSDHAVALVGGGPIGGPATLTVQAQGFGQVSPGGGTFTIGTPVTLQALPSFGNLFIGWTVDGAPAGWANPLHFTLAGNQTVTAAFAPLPGFRDVAAGQPITQPVLELAARGVINGCAPDAVPPRFCPDDPTLRHQMAALIVRAMPGWADETWPNRFTDPTSDGELMRRVATLGHYNVAQGYAAETCAALRKASPCYGPLDPVRRGQVILFVARAMVAKGYWTLQPDDPSLFPDQNGTGDPADRATQDHRMLVTYVRYAGAPPDIGAAPWQPFAGWGEASTRGWFARALWQALDSYFAVDRVP